MIVSIDEAIKIPVIRKELIKKFLARCHTLSPPPNPLVEIDTSCIVYIGPSDSAGYKVFNASSVNLDYKIRTKAHILSYLLFKGPRGDQQVQHLCGVPHCANSYHLILGNHKQNGQHASKTRAKSKPDQQSWKLSEPDKIHIKNYHWTYNYSVKLLAEMYEVATQTIYTVLNN